MALAQEASVHDGDEDGLVPEQLVPLRSIHAMQPEARLALAVLEDAFATIRSTAGVRSVRARALGAKALTWVASDDVDHPFTFLNVCTYLGLEPAWIRAGIRRRHVRGLDGYGTRIRRNAGRWHAITPEGRRATL